MKDVIKFIIPFFFISQNCFSQGKIDKKISTDSLEKYIHTIIEEYKIPGVQAALVSGNEILNVTAVGVKKLDGDCLTVNSKMHLGSCGKAMTGFLAGILVEKKMIRWNSTVEELFPEFKSEINEAFLKASLKQLLSHQTQLPQFITGEEWKLLERFDEKQPKERRYQFAKWIMGQKQVPFDASDKKADFRYSNAGYSIAAAMLEKATGKSWEELITEELFKPLGIEANFGWPAATDKNQPFGHILDETTNELIPHNPNDDYFIDTILSPSGNISMSVLDYARFIQKNLNGLNGLDADYNKEFYEFLHYVNRPESEYSIGWYSSYQFDDDMSSHTGSADTFYCLNLVLRQHNIAVIVIANSATDETKTGLEKIRNFLFRPYLIK